MCGLDWLLRLPLFAFLRFGGYLSCFRDCERQGFTIDGEGDGYGMTHALLRAECSLVVLWINLAITGEEFGVAFLWGVECLLLWDYSLRIGSGGDFTGIRAVTSEIIIILTGHFGEFRLVTFLSEFRTS